MSWISDEARDRVRLHRMNVKKANRLAARIGVFEDNPEDLTMEERELLYEALLTYINTEKEAADRLEKNLDCGSEDGNLKSHDEAEILKGCIELMQGVAEQAQRFAFAAGYNIIEPDKNENGDYIDSNDEDLCEWWNYWFSTKYRVTEIVKRLFLWSTTHSGGTSTRAKCRQLGLDPSEEIEIGFNPEINEDNYFDD